MKTLRLHIRVWLSLLVLLALTVGSSFLRLGSLNLVLNLAIAALKAALVLVFFMRIGRSARSVQLAAAAGLVWLAMLASLSLTDFLYRE